jgi:hypothetical protein
MMLRSDGTGKQAEERGTSQWYGWVMGEGWCIHQNLLMASQLRGSNFGGRSSFGASGRASGSASTDRGGGTLAARVKFPTTSPASSRPPRPLSLDCHGPPAWFRLRDPGACRRESLRPCDS